MVPNACVVGAASVNCQPCGIAGGKQSHRIAEKASGTIKDTVPGCRISAGASSALAELREAYFITEHHRGLLAARVCMRAYEKLAMQSFHADCPLGK